MGILVGGRIKYVDRPGYGGRTPPGGGSFSPTVTRAAKPKRAKREAAPVDPKFLAKVRELRDRYLEHVNRGGAGGGGPQGGAGKYDPSKTLSPVEGSRTLAEVEGKPAPAPGKVKLLPRAA